MDYLAIAKELDKEASYQTIKQSHMMLAAAQLACAYHYQDEGDIQTAKEFIARAGMVEQVWNFHYPGHEINHLKVIDILTEKVKGHA